MHTSSGVDNIDEYLETVEEKVDGFYYLYGDQERPLTTTQISVPYMTGTGMAQKEFTVHRTHHGPIVREVDGKWVSVRLMEEPLGKVVAAATWAEMGFSHLTMGNVERADELFQQGLTVSTAVKFLARPFLLVGSAIVALSTGKLDDAANLVNEAREFSEERAMKNVYPLIAFADANVTAASGDAAQALKRFEEGEESALEMKMRPLVWQLRLGAAGLLSSLGREREAEAKRRDARAMIGEIADLFEDDNLRRLFIENVASKIT